MPFKGQDASVDMVVARSTHHGSCNFAKSRGLYYGSIVSVFESQTAGHGLCIRNSITVRALLDTRESSCRIPALLAYQKY